MKLRSVLILVRFLLTFINRRVLGRGILRSRVAKILAIAIIVGSYIGYCLLTVVVLRQYFGPEITEILLLSASVATPLWVLIAYIVVRVLFLKADEIMQLTFTLPATNRERTLAFATFESLLVLGAAFIVFGAFMIGAVSISGLPFLGRAIAAIFFPAILSFLTYSVIYMLFERMAVRLGLARSRGLLMPLLFTVAMLGMFILAKNQSEALFDAYIREESLNLPQLSFLNLADSLHPLVALALFAAFVGVLLALVLLVAPREYEPMKRNYRVLSSSLASSEIGIHLLALIRSFETLIVLIFAGLATVALAVTRIEMPPLILLLVTFQGVYAYANTEPIRRTTPAVRGATSSYISLVLAQAIILGFAAVPAIAVSTALGIGLQYSVLVIVFCLCNILLTTLVGILFPADNGNPFSVVIGVILVFAIVALLAIGLDVFGFPMIVNIGIVVILAGGIVANSISGMNKLERTKRYDLVA